MIFNLPSYNRLARRAARPAVWGFWRWWPSCFAAFAIWYACIRKATSLESPCGSNPRRGILEVLCTDAPQITQTTATRIYHLGFRQGRAQLDKVRNPLSMRFCPHRGGSVKLGGGAGLPLIGSVGANGGQETPCRNPTLRQPTVPTHRWTDAKVVPVQRGKEPMDWQMSVYRPEPRRRRRRCASTPSAEPVRQAARDLLEQPGLAGHMQLDASRGRPARLRREVQYGSCGPLLVFNISVA